MKKLLLILITLTFLTGCYNYRELNDLAIVTAISISKEKDNYNIAVQVVNPKKDQDTSSSNEPDFIVYKSKGETLQAAFESLVKESPKRMYKTQMQILIIDEKMAKNNIKEVFEYLARDPEIRNEFNVLIGKSDNILETLTPLDNLSSQNILDSLKASSKYLGNTNLLTFNELLSDYQNEKTEMAMPVIKLSSQKNKDDKNNEKILEKTTTTTTAIVLDNIGIFKDNKLIGYLSTKETISYNFINNNIALTNIKKDYPNNKYIAYKILKSKSKLEVTPKKHTITLTIKGNAEINEATYNIDLSKEKNIKKLEKSLNKRLEKMITSSFNSTRKKYNSDIYGFEDLYYKKDPKYYNKIKKDWDSKEFQKIKLKVKSNIKIVEQGNISGKIKG